MDTHNPTTGKIAASPTDNAWAQAHSAGKLYTVISLSSNEPQNFAALGRETAEKLQREFFALDQKSLKTIKKAVESVLSELPKDITYSCVVSTTVKDAFYIVIGGQGYTLLSRNGKTSIVAAGSPQTVSSFSGFEKPDDVFLLATDGFLKTVSHSEIESILAAKTPHEASEELALLVRENATGNEAALVIKNATPKHITQPAEENQKTLEEEEEENDHLELGDEKEKKKFAIPAISFISLKSLLPSKLSKKILIGIAVVILLIVLGGGIMFEYNKRQSESNNAVAQKIINNHMDRYEEAVAVMPLNKSLATESLTEIQAELEKEKEQFPPNSAARNSIEEFLQKVVSAMGGSTSNTSPISVFFEPKDSINTIAFATNKGGTLTIAGGTTAGTVSSSGSVDETFETGNAKGVSGSENNIYILTSSTVEKINKNSTDSEDIFEVSGAKSMDTFGDNVYVLENKTINKYRPNTYAKEAYFTGDVTLTDPSSIAIDASIYVVDNGTIRKFTRGAEDSFKYSGPKLSNKSLAYTDEDYANLYVVDPSTQMAYVISKSGNKVSEFSLKGMRTITGISANETDKKIYIAGDNKIYSINF